MIFIPSWISDVLFLITVYLAAFQHVQLQRPNPITNIQAVMCVFGLVMILVVWFDNQINPWLSFGFFLTAVASLGLIIRQHRMLPPRQQSD
nr:hypothetical protein [uncultured Rhodopila sp.]